jgi:small subunit ribosomal protein S17
MPKKKKEDTAEDAATEVNGNESTEEASVEAQGNDNAANNEDAVSTETTENSDSNAEGSLLGSVFDAVSSVVGNVAEAVVGGATNLVNAVTGDESADEASSAKKTSKRAEKIGTVQSDKMTKTVTVRVDRVVKHPMYRKYVKRRKKFMAHDELGAKIGDKVRIIETRPLSAKKRWRVVEIIQKAER